jgi:broad specificity phosphatase PhoE
MKELYFVRHGQTEWNAIRRMQGQWNSNLNDLGRQQAHTNGQFLERQNIDYLVASPLDRTTQTAEIINQYLNLDVRFDERIMEWHCGDWSGEMWDEVPHKWPEEFSAWQENQFHYRGPGCENYPDMIERAGPFLDELLKLPQRRLAVISHGMIGRVLVGTLLGMSENDMFTFGQANDTVFHLTQHEDRFLTQHFVGGDGPFEGLPPRQY